MQVGFYTLYTILNLPTSQLFLLQKKVGQLSAQVMYRIYLYATCIYSCI